MLIFPLERFCHNTLFVQKRDKIVPSVNADEAVTHKLRISFKSAFKLALNDFKTCPSRQNQKLQGKKWAYFSNWTLGLRVTASETFILGTILYLFWTNRALWQNLSRGKISMQNLTIKWKKSHLAWQNHTWPHFAAS